MNNTLQDSIDQAPMNIDKSQKLRLAHKIGSIFIFILHSIL